MSRAERKRVYRSSDVSKQSRADGLEEIILPGTLTVAVPMFLAVIVAAEQAGLELVLKGGVLATFDPVFPVEVLVKDYLSDPRLLSECTFPRTTIKLVSRHS